MSFETHFFPFWERTKNVLRDKNDFDIDSLMGTKKMPAVFRNSCLSQSGVIVDAKVSDRQRRCCAPCRNVIGYKSSFTCHVLLGSCPLSCWVLFKELQGEISLFLIMILCYLAPATRYSSQFTFHVFFPKAVFGFTQALRRIFRRIEMGFFATFDRRVICTTIQENQRLRQRRVVDTVFRHSNKEQKMSFETYYSS